MSSTKLLTTNPQSLITIVIPTFNNDRGLNYLLHYFSKLDYPVIIVDNHPTEEKEKMYSTFPPFNFTTLQQKYNIGFAAAINRGVEKVKTDWLLILNDDIEFTNTGSNEIFQQLLSFTEKNHFIAVSPVLKNEKDEVENYGYRVLPFGRTELIKTFQPSSIDGLTAACLLIQTKIFRKLNGFDESFFAYLEDVDFFLRLKKQRFGIDSSVSVIHHHLTTSKTMRNFKQKQDFINWIRLILKHPSVFRLYKLYELDNFMNLINLVMERFRNLSGLIKATILC